MKRYKKTKYKPFIPDPVQTMSENLNVSMDGDIENTIHQIQHVLGQNDDFVLRRFHVFGEYPAAMCYYAGMVDQKVIAEHILKPLMSPHAHMEHRSMGHQQLAKVLFNDTLSHSEVKQEHQLAKLIAGILRGETVIVVDQLEEAFLIGSRSIDKRAIEQPATEQVVRGPREGFIESLETNIALLRYRLQTPEFIIKMTEVGRRTKTKVAICYLQDVANPNLVNEVNRRLSQIDIDAVLDSGYLEQLIEDNHLSPFPQVQYTERPDKIAANLLEGRVALLVDGSPLGLLVPTVFNQFYQTVEDYTERFFLMSAVRLSRFIALIFSLIFPALYVAVISFNPELIPTEFAVAVAGGRAGVPFPAVIEVLIMEVSMEVLREATIRLPQQIGGALSIVGVLVIGQAAVAAGFASPITVVIVALTTIGSFATPAYNAALALRLLRFPLFIMAGIFGLYGIVVGLILIINHLISLKSFGIPYLSPLVPGNLEGAKDLFIRGPLWSMKKRPLFLHPLDETRIGNHMAQVLNEPPNNALDPLKSTNRSEEH